MDGGYSGNFKVECLFQPLGEEVRCAYADVADHAHARSDTDTVLPLHGGNNVQQDGTDLTVAASMSKEIFNSADMRHDCVVAGAVF